MPELGIYVPREEEFVNLRIVDGHFELYFLDKEKKVIKPVFNTAILRYENIARKDRDERVTLRLTSGGGHQYLTSGRVIKPPFKFWVNFIFKDSDDPDKKVSLGRHRLMQ